MSDINRVKHFEKITVENELYDKLFDAHGDLILLRELAEELIVLSERAKQILVLIDIDMTKRARDGLSPITSAHEAIRENMRCAREIE